MELMIIIIIIKNMKNQNFVQKLKFWSKIEILVNPRNFGQKSKFWSKIQILFKNLHFGQKSKFCSKIFWFKFDFCRSKLWSKIESFVIVQNDTKKA